MSSIIKSLADLAGDWGLPELLIPKLPDSLPDNVEDLQEFLNPLLYVALLKNRTYPGTEVKFQFKFFYHFSICIFKHFYFI